MAMALNGGVDLALGTDPVSASIPRIQGGYMAAVYYVQRRSGDFYDFVRTSRERVLFGMFDVAGGLQEARAIMVPLQRAFRCSTPQLFNGPTVNETECLLELWLELNKAVMTAAARGVHSCPAFLGCYNEDVQTLTYVNAGHIPALCRAGDQISALGATALPLGLFSHSIPECSLLALGAGNGLLLVSKGVVEAKRRGEEFGIERVQQYFAETVVQSAHETCVGILAHVRQFMGTAPTHNDVTALSLIRSLEAE